MKNLVLILLIGVSVAFSNKCEGQAFLKRMADKALEKVIDKNSEKIEQAADSTASETLEQTKNQSGNQVKSRSDEERSNAALKGLMGRMGVDTNPVNIEDSYSFNSNIKMNIETYNASGGLINKGYFNSFFDNKNETFAYEILNEEGSETGKGFIIYDSKNKASIILSEKDGEKNGIVTGININYTEEQKAASEDLNKNTPETVAFNPNLKKTGRSKTIEGYHCDEYLYEDEEVVSNMWITKEKVWKINNMLSTVYKSSYYTNGFPAGFMMEVDSKNKQTNERNHMLVTEIKENINKKVDLSTYKIMNMGTLNMEGVE